MLVKTALLANVSHELRTPMSSVIGLAKLLLQADIAPAQRDRANKIRAAAQSLLRMLDDILSVSKMEAGRVKLEQRDFTLDGVTKNRLAVHPHAVNREIAVDLLEGLGFEVAATADGFEALACLGREQFDAVLLDTRMPGLESRCQGAR